MHSAIACRPGAIARPPRRAPSAGRPIARRCRPVARPLPTCLATPQRTADRGKAPGKGGGRPDGGDDDDDGTSLALFRWALYTRPWDVPWGGRETAGVMLGWAAAFVATGVAVGPLFLRALGAVSPADLSASDKALYLLVNQIAETVVGLTIVYKGVDKFRPLPGDVLVTDPARPFARRDGWLTWALLTAVASPFAIACAGALAAAVSGSEPVGRGTADAVAGVLGADASTVAALFVVTAILAPILEETVFRGFLLPSLTKWMPVPAAVCVSALAFAGAHLSARDFPQLAAFGVLLGFSYARSRNLLTTMAVHGAWNGSVLLVLAALSASGVDLGKMLAGEGGG